LAWVALSPAARAVDPPPDGGYANDNTAEGEDALFSLTSEFPTQNTAVGAFALYLLNDGSWNTAVGAAALYECNGGFENTGIGLVALANNTDGDCNTAVGGEVLYFNTIGSYNVATGCSALYWNTTGSYNVANGLNALYFNSTGSYNTAQGTRALYNNSTASYNTANGVEALYGNSSGGDYNTANGYHALYTNTTGAYNVANGVNALYSNTVGILNTATGLAALYANTEGSYNTADGYQALAANTTGTNNTACGIGALLNNSTGNSNVALGSNAGANLATGNNNIDIGNAGIAGESNTIRIGAQATQTATYIAGISGVIVVRGAAPVFIDSTGRLGTNNSSARFKENIKPMNKASEAILALNPVAFSYKKELDPEGTPQFGLVAEEVEKVNPDLVARDDEGKPYTVRYDAVNAMLLNEFLKEHRKVAALEAKIAQQESTNLEQEKLIQGLITSMKEQAAHIQQVSVQLAGIQPDLRLATNE
jgi:hypothetical protein